MLVCEAIWESKRMEINAQWKECHILGLCFAGCVSILSREFGLFYTGGPVVFVVVGTMRTLRHPRLRLRSLAALSFVPIQGLCSFVFSFFRSYSHSFVRMSFFRWYSHFLGSYLILVLSIIICRSCIFSLYIFLFAHFEDDDECSGNLTTNGWIFNMTSRFVFFNFSYAFIFLNNFVFSFCLCLCSFLCASFFFVIFYSFSIALSTLMMLWTSKLWKRW
jgi:hypothetical protein